MSNDRYNALMSAHDLPLEAAEIAEGWHWCWDWDFLLVGPGMPELEHCYCKGNG